MSTPDVPVAAANQIEGISALVPAVEDRRLAARLFGLLGAGERVAERIAGIEARLAPTAREARFFRSQARQERLHAMTFEWVRRSLELSGPDGSAIYRPFLRRLDAAARAGRYLECVLATQVILESVGEHLLRELDAALARRGIGFHRLRRLFLEQEAAHHAFGRALIHDALRRGHWSVAALVSNAEPYLANVASWLAEEAAMADAFEFDGEKLVSAVAREVIDLATAQAT